jgi:hypothetical protein
MLQEFNELLGHTLTAIEVNEDRDAIKLTLDNGERYILYHYQDCCERVTIEDICGELADLLNLPLLLAEEVTYERKEVPEGLGGPYEEEDESFTWTFYKLATNRGAVTIRWYGSSNGYYSEKVDFEPV